jgi:hypothetical protein
MNADTIKTQGQALAAALGKHWKFEPTCYDETPSDWSFHLTDTASGLTLSAWAEYRQRKDERFTFSGSYAGNRHESDDPKATVSLKRPASSVAAELKRRVIAQAEQLHRQRYATQAKQEATKSKQYDITQQIAFALGGTEPSEQRYRRHDNELETGASKPYPGTSVTYTTAARMNGDIEIGLSAHNLPLDVALQIAYILRGATMKATT